MEFDYWNPDRLRRWITDAEQLLTEMSHRPVNPKLEWVEQLLKQELERKRALLENATETAA